MPLSFHSPLFSSLSDLSCHHYRFIPSVPAEGNIAKKGSIPFLVRVPRHIGRHPSRWELVPTEKKGMLCSREGIHNVNVGVISSPILSPRSIHPSTADGSLPRAPIRQREQSRAPREPLLHSFTCPLTHSVNGSFFGSSFEKRRNSSSQFAPSPQQRMMKERKKERKKERGPQMFYTARAWTGCVYSRRARGLDGGGNT